MSFASDLDRFTAKVNRRAKRIESGLREQVQRSVVEGSELTGAPGQPIGPFPGGGTLKGSFIPRFLGPGLWITSSALLYAPVIENLYNTRTGAITIRSSVGGGHSVKMTRAGWQRIVNHVAREVVRD